MIDEWDNRILPTLHDIEANPCICTMQTDDDGQWTVRLAGEKVEMLQPVNRVMCDSRRVSSAMLS